MVAGIFLRLSSSDGTSEEILVFLVGEVHVIVSVSVRELSRVVSVILPGSLGTEGLSMSPGLQLQVRDGSVSVVITDLHGTSVCLVIDNFSSKHVLLLFTETLKDVLGANFHNADFVVEADLGVSRVLGRAHLELADLSVATSGDEVRYKSHVLGVLHVRLGHRAGFVSESFVLSVGVPIVMGLVMPMVLLEWVIEVTVQPVELGNDTQVEGHLRVIIGGVVVTGTDRVDGLVGIGVDHLVTPVVVRLLPEVLREVGGVEIDTGHI
jgi:hypothetical protein